MRLPFHSGKRSMTVRPLLLLFLITTLSGAGTVALFDPSSREIGPFPSNSLTVPDPAQLTGLRVNLPVPDCAQEPSSCQELAEVNLLDGFNLAPRIVVRFSGPVDTSTLREGIFLVTSVPNAIAQSIPLNRIVYDPRTFTVYAEPDAPLERQRTYLLVVLDRVRDTAGDPIVADPRFRACIAIAAPSAYCAALGAAVSPITVAASFFTTLSATSFLEKARAALAAAPLDFERTGDRNVFRTSAILAVTVRQQTGANPSVFENTLIPLPGLVLDNVGRIAFGSFRSPQFLDERHMLPVQPTAAPVHLPQASERIYFHAYLPEKAAPANGYPVVIFGHGLNDSRFGSPTLVAGRFAEEGFSTVAINAFGHGAGPEGTVSIFDTSFRTTTLPGGGRSVDQNGDGSIDSREGCLLVEPIPIGLRDCLRQTVLDLAQLVRLIRAGVDLDGDGTIDLDSNRIYYAGQSFGAMYGTALHAIEPGIRAAALNVGGGSVVDIVRLSPSFQFILRDYLVTRQPQLLPPDAPFDAQIPPRDQPVRDVNEDQPLAIQRMLERVEWFQMPGDPLAYAPHIRFSPLPGSVPKPALWQFARGDRTVPNPATSNLIRWAQMQDSSTLYRHDLARAADPLLPENPHAFLVDIRSPVGLAVAAAAQGQIARFLAADGASVPEPALVFGQDLFDTPAPLVEDTGFSGGSRSMTLVSSATYQGPAAAPGSLVSAFRRGGRPLQPFRQPPAPAYFLSGNHGDHHRRRRQGLCGLAAGGHPRSGNFSRSPGTVFGASRSFAAQRGRPSLRRNPARGAGCAWYLHRQSIRRGCSPPLR